MAEEIQTGVTATVVETTEPAWVPGAKKVSVILQPAEGEEPYYPPVTPSPDLPSIPGYVPAIAPPPERMIFLNIETTGIDPTTSRIIHIAALTPEDPEKVIEFTDEDEVKIISDFSSWFEAQGFTQIVGYGVAFDYRFIYTRLMKYLLSGPVFYAARLHDMMNVMEQVKTEFVYGFNKPGSLNDWIKFFFGRDPPHTQEAVFEAWEKKDLGTIREYNRWKVNQVLDLWILSKFAEGVLRG